MSSSSRPRRKFFPGNNLVALHRMPRQNSGAKLPSSSPNFCRSSDTSNTFRLCLSRAQSCIVKATFLFPTLYTGTTDTARKDRALSTKRSFFFYFFYLSASTYIRAPKLYRAEWKRVISLKNQPLQWWREKKRAEGGGWPHRILAKRQAIANGYLVTCRMSIIISFNLVFNYDPNIDEAGVTSVVVSVAG